MEIKPMRFVFDFVVRMAGSQIIEATSRAEAKKKLNEFVAKQAGRELVDLQIIHENSGIGVACMNLNDLKELIKKTSSSKDDTTNGD